MARIKRSLFGTPIRNGVLPSRRDNPNRAQGAGKASHASLGAALGCEANPLHSVPINPSPNGTALIRGVICAHFDVVHAVPFRAATLWLPMI